MPSSAETDHFSASVVPIVSGEISNRTESSAALTAVEKNPEGNESLANVRRKTERVREPDEKPKSKGNFIEKYREYADVLEAPPEAHEAVAMGLIAAVLNRNGTTILHGAVRVSMDLWTLLISESGFGPEHSGRAR